MKSVLCSKSVLNYGTFIPSKQVSLNPSVAKTELEICWVLVFIVEFLDVLLFEKE